METMQDSLSTHGLKVDAEPRIGVLVNPLSGGNRSRTDDLRQTVGECPWALQRDVQGPADVAAALEAFAGHRVNLLVVSGGDGTVQAVLTTLFHHRPFETPPPLMILQAGTTSMTAQDVGVLGSQRKALQRLFHWKRSGSGKVSTIERPVLRVQVPGHGVHCGMFFGIGIICRAIQYYHRHLHTENLRGLPGILLTMIRFLLAVFNPHSRLMLPTPLTVCLNHRPPQKVDASFVFVSTLERLLLGLYPFWGTETGALNYTAVASPFNHPLQALPFLGVGRRNRYSTPANGYESHRVDAVRFYLDSSVTLDGQIYTPSTAKDPTVVRCGGRATFLRL